MVLSENLQIGDYIPFIEIEGVRVKKHMHNFCNNNPFIFITIKKLNDFANLQEFADLTKQFNVILLFENGNIEHLNTGILYTQDLQLRKMLNIQENVLIYVTTPNRRIISILTYDEFIREPINLENCLPKHQHIPYLLIENALDKELLKKVIDYYNIKKKEDKLTAHKHSGKDRLHIHPDAELEKEIDHKLSRSVLPELKKVFYFDVEYRENYKICSYDAESSGRFHPHRDTPAPQQHRKYALSLLLNDDYEGGEFALPEYGIKIKPKANTALIFPGINTHQVLPVIKGSRMTIISFFINGNTKPQYKMMAHFYKDKNIIESQIYPL